MQIHLEDKNQLIDPQREEELRLGAPVASENRSLLPGLSSLGLFALGKKK